MRPYIAYTHQDNVKKEGWILKKSKHIKQYHKRFMQLKGSKLSCYKNIQFGKKTHERPTETFDLSVHEYRIETHDKMKQKFYLIDETISQSRSFKTLSELDRQIWVFKIRNVIAVIKMSSRKNKNKLNNTRKTRGLSITTTYESEMSDTNEYQMYDSDSDPSDDDNDNDNDNDDDNDNFNKIQLIHTRKRKMSKRKMQLDITSDSFCNFRIRSLTIDSQLLPDFSDEEDDTDTDADAEIADTDTGDGKQPEMSLLTLNEDNDDFNKIYEVIDEKEIKECDEDIIDQLKIFGYNRSEILDAMDAVTNPKDINEIRDKLDAESTANTPRRAAFLIVNKDASAEIEERNKKRKYIEQEIVTSEETYCQALQTLLNELIQPMFDNKYIDKKYYKQIRSSLPNMLEFHKDLLCHFEYFNDENTEDKTVVNVFKDYIVENKKKFIDINIEYIKDYQTICSLFGCIFHGNVKLDEFLKSKRKEMKPLSSFLMLPIQRIPRYIYFLTHLRKNTEEKSNKSNESNKSNDYVDINNTIELMEGIINELTDSKEKIENLAQCLQIQEALNGLKESIVNNDRIFLQQFIFIKKCIKHQRLFFVFNDIVIVANEKWNVKKILDIRTLDVKIMNEKNTKSKKKAPLPEFKLVTVRSGSNFYVGKDMKAINKFKKLIGKWRVRIMTTDLRNRLDTLGSLKYELGRQALLYD